MPMKRITFVRHGQSLANIGGMTMANDAIPLTRLGQLQANKLAELLPRNPSEVWVSAFARAQQTAAPYCERVGLAPRVHPLTHEFCTFDPALLEGMSGAERMPIVNSYWQEADPAKRMGVNAETFHEFGERVEAFLVGSLPRIATGAVFFGHGLWMAMLCWKLLGFKLLDSQGMRDFRRFQLGLPTPNGAAHHLIEVREAEWKIQVDEAITRAVGEVEEPFPVVGP